MVSELTLHIPDNALPKPFLFRDAGKSISKEERDECWRRCDVYRLWLLDRVFKAESKERLRIMVLPIDSAVPSYRDAPEPYVPQSRQHDMRGFNGIHDSAYGLLNGHASLNMSPIMRAPEVTAIGIDQYSFPGHERARF